MKTEENDLKKAVIEDIKKEYILLRKNSFYGTISFLLLAFGLSLNSAYKAAKTAAIEKAEEILKTEEYQEMVAEIDGYRDRASERIQQLESDSELIDIINAQGSFEIETKIEIAQVAKDFENKAVVSPAEGYSLVGGGAFDNNNARYLRGSYPNDNKWNAISQDRNSPVTGLMTAYAIGARVVLSKNE